MFQKHVSNSECVSYLYELARQSIYNGGITLCVLLYSSSHSVIASHLAGRPIMEHQYV